MLILFPIYVALIYTSINMIATERVQQAFWLHYNIKHSRWIATNSLKLVSRRVKPLI